MIWEPFVLALVLGLIVSAGLYFAYLWPSVEPLEEPELATSAATPARSVGAERPPSDTPTTEPASPGPEPARDEEVAS